MFWFLQKLASRFSWGCGSEPLLFFVEQTIDLRDEFQKFVRVLFGSGLLAELHPLLFVFQEAPLMSPKLPYFSDLALFDTKQK